jgi:hypothetical protein
MAPVKATKAAATKKGGATKKTAAAKKGGVSKKTAATKPAKAGRQGPKATQAEKELAFLLKCFRSVEPEDGVSSAVPHSPHAKIDLLTRFSLC